MSSIAERVRGLIQSNGLSQRAFAAEIRLDDTKLSKSLAGVRRFTSSDLARIAERCSVTVDWLVTGREVPLTMAARSAGGTAAQALAEAQRIGAFRTDVTYLGYPQPWRPPPSASSETARAGSWVEQGERLATAALGAVTAAGRSAQDADLAGLVEDVFGADVVVTDLDADFDGLAVSSDDVKLVLAATSAIPGRQRFTIAHELGHLLAGDDQQVHVDEDVYARSHRREPSEVRANAFAAAFLMPAPVLREVVGTTGLDEHRFGALSSDLGVSPSALAVRLKALRLVDSGTCDRFCAISGARAAQLAGRGEQYGRHVAISRAARLPGLLVRDTYLAYQEGRATLRPYATLLGVDVERLAAALEQDHQAVILP